MYLRKMAPISIFLNPELHVDCADSRTIIIRAIPLILHPVTGSPILLGEKIGPERVVRVDIKDKKPVPINRPTNTMERLLDAFRFKDIVQAIVEADSKVEGAGGHKVTQVTREERDVQPGAGSFFLGDLKHGAGTINADNAAAPRGQEQGD